MPRLTFPSAALATLVVLTAACSSGDTNATPTTTVSHPSTSARSAPTAGLRAKALCDDAKPEVAGPITDPELTEISGVVASPDQDDVLWVHEDSGAPAVIWALDADGMVLARDSVTDAKAVDWEDIAWRVDRPTDQAYLFLADIGDNAFTPVIGKELEPRSASNPATIYRVPEPDAAKGDAATGSAEAFSVDYSDGPRDAEAMLVDPVTEDAFVVSKQWDGKAAGLYRLSAKVVDEPHAPTGITTMKRVADVAGTQRALVTGADISLDGSLVVLRTYGDIRLWARSPDQSLATTLAAPPTCTRRVAEKQGEAIAVANDGRALVAISEDASVPVNWLRLPPD